MDFLSSIYVLILLCCSFAGIYAQLSEYPWMGIIEYQKENRTKLSCSAILISGRYMLSAAQCFAHESSQLGTPTNVRLGEYDTSNDGPDCLGGGDTLECNEGAVKVPIEKIIKHPDYNKDRTFTNDIALIRLAHMAPLTNFIQPICLPSSDITMDPPSRRMWAAGWGVINGSNSTNGRLHHVELPYVDINTCQSAFNNSKVYRDLGNGQLCAGGDGKDTCRGDSGGPLMYVRDYTTEVAGIVSFGPRICGIIGIPSVYTKVFAYDSWIRANIED